MNSSGVAMDFRSRIDPAEEARHREVMDGLGVYDAQWALSKVLEQSDVQAGQNRLLLTKDMVRAGSIPKVFPELEELGEDGRNAEHKVSVRVFDADGREKEVNLRYLNSNKAYRVMGSEWRRFVDDSCMCKGDRFDLYTCRRGDGERCLFSFTTKGWDATGGSAAWCTNGRKRARQSAAAAAVIDPDYEQVYHVNGGRAPDGDIGKHCGDVDYTRAKRDRGRDLKIRRAKNGSSRATREDQMVFVTNDGMHAWTGGFQEDYGCYKPKKRREDKASWVLNATPDEREAAKGLLMLKYAIYAEHYY